MPMLHKVAYHHQSMAKPKIEEERGSSHLEGYADEARFHLLFSLRHQLLRALHRPQVPAGKIPTLTSTHVVTESRSQSLGADGQVPGLPYQAGSRDVALV